MGLIVGGRLNGGLPSSKVGDFQVREYSGVYMEIVKSTLPYPFDITNRAIAVSPIACKEPVSVQYTLTRKRIFVNTNMA